MNWFKRKKVCRTPIVVEPPVTSRVEIELHKSASQDAARKADQTNEHLRDLLAENGFTLKIFLPSSKSS